MAKFVTNIDLNFNELQNAVLNPVDADPSTLKEGMVWYNTTEKEFRCYKNGEIKPLGAQAQYSQVATVDELPTDAQQGDFGVVVTSIGNETGKNSYTGYIFDDGVWKAMDGNYDANNVYFDDNITYTVGIGTLAKPASSGTWNVKGKSLKEALAGLVANENDPDRTLPSVNLSNANGYGTYEIGTIKNLTYTGSLSAGSYTYGPATGITATSWSASCTGVSETKTTNTGTFENVVAEATNKVVTVTANYTQGAIPVTNLGNPCETMRIPAGSASKATSGFVGVRYMFWGPMSDGGAELNSANIRALSNKKAVNTGALTTFGAGAGAQKVVVAVPAGRRISKVIMPSALNADVTSLFIKQSTQVQVEGANGYAATAYDVYVYQPASIDSGETYTVTIA